MSSVALAHATYRQKCEEAREGREQEENKGQKAKKAEMAKRQKEMDNLRAKNASLLEKKTTINKRGKELGAKLEGFGKVPC